MSLEESPINLYVEHNHNHLLSSDEAGWKNLGLVYELEPAGEMPGAIALAHVLIVPQGEFQASFHIEGQWQQEEYRQGDVALIPAGSFFPTVKVNREVPLIDLFLPPDVLLNGLGESAAKVQLRPQFKVQDPLIQLFLYFIFISFYRFRRTKTEAKPRFYVVIAESTLLGNIYGNISWFSCSCDYRSGSFNLRKHGAG